MHRAGSGTAGQAHLRVVSLDQALAGGAAGSPHAILRKRRSIAGAPYPPTCRSPLRWSRRLFASRSDNVPKPLLAFRSHWPTWFGCTVRPATICCTALARARRSIGGPRLDERPERSSMPDLFTDCWICGGRICRTRLGAVAVQAQSRLKECAIVEAGTRRAVSGETRLVPPTSQRSGSQYSECNGSIRFFVRRTRRYVVF